MSTLRPWIPSLAVALLACGGTVVFEEGGDGGNGSGGSRTTSSASGPSSGSNSTASGSGPSASSGAGGSTGGGTSVSVVSTSVSSGSVGTGTGGGSACGDLNYADCLGANDRCVPQFDDMCCPSCFPGGCADCLDFQAVGCIDREPGGRPGGGEDHPGPPPPNVCGSPSCGFVPSWACDGERPDCSNGCFGNAGCVEKLRCEGDSCELGCEPVAPDACGPVTCNGAPPQCGDGQIAEASGGCWTGFCIPMWVCQFPSL